MLEERLIEVRQLLGDQHNIPDKEIRETLWYYYFDLEKTVAWLLGNIIRKSMLTSLDKYAGAARQKTVKQNKGQTGSKSTKGNSTNVSPWCYCFYCLSNFAG
jgi:hypothetical protein